MNVIVDTSVWSLALRRDAPRETAPERELGELVREGRVLIAGPIRQELLSGVRAPAQYKALRDKLRAFPDIALGTNDYENASACFNRCRSKGVQGSNTDFLLCAVALRLDAGILTTDKDFDHFARILRIKLHRPRHGLSA
ncbi:MAG TPA: PIN domain-containing protein [Polyangiaceae bacterium]|nr:PIN domain-containing protein [Polyangiaceae bacterium]